MATNRLLHVLFHMCFGLLLSLIHIFHISRLFENQTKFSHLSRLERELSLAPHEAFYYQFYKRLIDAPSMEEGLSSLAADNITEFNEGLTINSIRRFHIMPEVILSFLYRHFMILAAYLNIPVVNCYYVEPDENSKIDDEKVFVNCEGLGEPIFFYLAITWSLSAITIFLLYMYGYFLHRSFFAGCATIVYFFCSHENATNVHRMPMMRHNFAIPFIIWQTFYLNLYVDRHVFSTDNRNDRTHHRNFAMIISMVIFSTIANVFWDMSSHIFLAQSIALFLVLQCNDRNGNSYIASGLVFDFAMSQVIANCLSYFLMYGNSKFLISGNMSTNIALIIYIVRMRVLRLPTEEENPNFRVGYRRFFYVLFFFLSTCWFIQDLMDRFVPYVQDYTTSYHVDLIMAMLHLKLPNFYTLLTYYRDNAYEVINVGALRVYCLVFLFKNLSIFISIKFYQFLDARRRKIDENVLEMRERAKNYVIEDFLETNRVTMKDLQDPKTEMKIQENLKLLEACNYDYQLYKIEKASKKLDLRIVEKANFMNDIRKLKTQIQSKSKLEKKTINFELSGGKVVDEISTDTSEEELSDDCDEKSEVRRRKVNNENSQATCDDKSSLLKDSSKSGDQNFNKIDKILKNLTNLDNENFVENEKEESPGCDKNDSEESSENSRKKESNKDEKPQTSDNSSNSKKETPQFPTSNYQVQPYYAFALIQTATISVVGLKFVLTPFLCLISATLPSRMWFRNTSTRTYLLFYVFLVACTLNYPGLKSLRYQYEFKNEFRNPELENLIEWIEKTDSNAVFAAPLELSAHILLTTKRPIVNHPLIEYPEIIERTKALYSIFSKRTSTEVYNQLVKLRVQFVVIPYETCFLSSKDGVRIIDIWDFLEPDNYSKKAFCVSLFQKTNPTFLKVFENVKFIVIQIFSQSIQLELKKKTFPEVQM